MTDTNPSIWQNVAAPLPQNVIQWRQQGKPVARNGQFIARFVAYIDAQFVRERLDTVVPGEWDLILDLLPPAVTTDGEEVEPFAFKARLQINGVIRESIGQGKDYKTAETDAFKRAAVRFGIGAELYAMEQLWCQLDGDGKFAKPVVDPAIVYARKSGHAAPTPVAPARVLDKAGVEKALDMAPTKPAPAGDSENPCCPVCDGAMWDNRVGKKNPNAPDFKCKNAPKTRGGPGCEGVIWPPKDKPSAVPFRPGDEPVHDDADMIPF